MVLTALYKASRMRKLFTPKTWLIMKLTIVFTLIACMQVSASGNAQTVSISGKNLSLEKVFKEIRKQAGYEFVYKTKMLGKAKTVDINAKNLTVEKVLEICFANQPFTYTIIDKTIVVKEKQTVDLQSTGIPPNEQAIIINNEPPPPIDITGKVTDENGNPLIGASVKVKGSNKGTTTNNDGVFVLKGVDEDSVLEISYVGFEMLTISVNNRTSIVTSLKAKPENLNEVVINKGYYTEKQRFSVGNVGKVTAKEIEKQPVNNPLLALQGRVPGLFITQNSGVPGSSIKVQIQGQNSLLYGSEPLYIIDGVPYTSQMLPTFSAGLSNEPLGGYSNTSGAVGNPLSFINPSDIESIDILKDADATAIYGSRAANGAILITTKKGKNGPAKIQFNIQQGWGKVASRLEMMNTQEYLLMRREAIKNDNDVTNAARDYDIMGLYGWDTTRSIDWQKELLGGVAHYTNANATVSGGTGLTQYSVGATYQRESSVFPGSFSDQKGGFHLNINTASSNQKFRLQFSGNYLVDNNLLPRADLTAQALSLPSTAPTLYNADGSLNWGPNASGASTWTNPLSSTIKNFQNKADNLIANTVLDYQLFKELEIKSSFGYTRLNANTFLSNPLASRLPEDRPSVTRRADYSFNNISSWIIEPQVNYKKNVGKGKFDALIGATFQSENDQGQSYLGIGYVSDAVIKDIRSAPTLSVTNSVSELYKYAALFTRINYNLSDRYVINLSARRDGSSRFGDANQFHNFGSVGAGWIFSEESFLKNNLFFLSFGKLKGSYGTTGNDQIGNYLFMNLYSPVSVPSIVPYQGLLGILPQGLPNPHLQWEETRKLQAGIELGFFNDHVSLTTNRIINRSSNQLLSYTLPIITGFPSMISNLPATVQNTSWEFILNASIIQPKQIEWRTGFNFTLLKNKLVSFDGLASSPYASRFEIGKPITISKVFHYLGVDQTTGKYIFADKDGHATSSPNSATDRTVIINNFPSYFGGLQNTLRYNGIELDIFLQFTKQTRDNVLRGIGGGTPGLRRLNEPTSVLSRWQKPGDITTIQRFNTMLSPNSPSLIGEFGNMQNSDATYTDVFFARLKNISLSYQLPKGWVQKANISDCQLYVHAQNVLTFTKFKGLDAETGNSVLPPLRIITVGVQVGL
jgi:TonB-linked SusC/RagA family outer membrane protein